jgi:hypothetical protein
LCWIVGATLAVALFVLNFKFGYSNLFQISDFELDFLIGVAKPSSAVTFKSPRRGRNLNSPACERRENSRTIDQAPVRGDTFQKHANLNHAVFRTIHVKIGKI